LTVALVVTIIPAMNADDRGMTIEELADLVGVPVRTVRYYITEGLLPGPGTRGKGTVYGEEHLLRLRLVRMLAEQRVPLAEIREQVGSLALPEVQALLNEEHRRAQRQARVAESPRAYISSLLDRARPGVQSPHRSQYASVKPQAPMAEEMRVDKDLTPQEEAGGEGWWRWELLPGIELSVRADALGRHRGLVEELLRVARSRSSR
jgi:Ca-activated chloride channel family protein